MVKVFSDELRVTDFVNKFPACYRTRISIVVSTKSLHGSLLCYRLLNSLAFLLLRVPSFHGICQINVSLLIFRLAQHSK